MNQDQSDRDSDGFGDKCDTFPDDPENDIDNDGIPVNADNCPHIWNTNQKDIDNDGMGDECDLISIIDSDDDQISDSLDNCINNSNTNQADFDRDGLGDVCDNDDDGDGINDNKDQCLNQTENYNNYQDTDGCPDSLNDKDTDGDGIKDGGDQCKTQPENFNGYQDTDGCPDEIVEDEPSPTPREETQSELGLASFVDPTRNPQYYVDRYNNEPSYKKWFNDNFSEYDSIYQAVGIEGIGDIPDGDPPIGNDTIPPGSSNNSLLYIIAGIAVIIPVITLLIWKSKKRKDTTSQEITPLDPSKISENRKKCNVCGTIIPEEKNTCPNCGDTYS